MLQFVSKPCHYCAIECRTCQGLSAPQHWPFFLGAHLMCDGRSHLEGEGDAPCSLRSTSRKVCRADSFCAQCKEMSEKHCAAEVAGSILAVATSAAQFSFGWGRNTRTHVWIGCTIKYLRQSKLSRSPQPQL